jgi:hypothetical protein
VSKELTPLGTVGVLLSCAAFVIGFWLLVGIVVGRAT